MKSGRELDELIAVHVMGWKRHSLRYSDECFIDSEGALHWITLIDNQFSTDIAAAWQVVEKLRETWAVELHSREGVWNCLIEEGDEVTAHYIATEEAENAPLAICLAALKAVGVEVEE